MEKVKENIEIGEKSKSDAVEVIREGLKELIQTERKERRVKTINKNRVALGDVITNSSFTPTFVAEKAKALKKKALPLEKYKQLQNALLQSEENVNSFLKVDNVLFALVRDMSGNDPNIQLCATSCACNIALSNTKAATSLTKSIGPYLVMELDTLKYPLLEVCVWTMGNLVAGSDKAFEILHAQDCLKYIISLMQNCDDKIISSVSYTAMHYVHVGFKHIKESELTKLAKAAAKRKLSFDNVYFIWLLALLSSQASCSLYLYNTVPVIVDYLHQNVTNNFIAVTEITACIRILANIVQEISGQLALFLLQNPKYTNTDVEMLLNRLLSSQYVHIRKEVLWLIGNLYNHNLSSIENLIRDTIPRLSSIESAMLSVSQPFNLNLPS